MHGHYVFALHHAKEDGKEHRYRSIVENRRCAANKVVQCHVLYLGEINDQQQASWQKTIEIFEHGQARSKTVASFAEDRLLEEVPDCEIVRLRLSELQLRRPRQWGACWLFCHEYRQLGLDQFWAQRLPPSRKGTRWDLVLQTLCAYRLIDPGSEWRLHRQWYEQSAMADLLGEDFSLAEIHTLYECHDLLLEHKAALFDHLTGKWKDLFHVKFDVLLYDLTSTYCESEPPFAQEDKRKFGYSRDKCPDCVQVVIGLIVTPEGFPLGYEVFAGNTSDKKTLKGFLEKIEKQYGKAQRIWLMDRGIPTEATLKEMHKCTKLSVACRLSRSHSMRLIHPFAQTSGSRSISRRLSMPERNPCSSVLIFKDVEMRLEPTNFGGLDHSIKVMARMAIPIQAKTSG